MKHEDFGRDRRCRSATLVAATYLNFSSKTKLTYNAITTQFSLWLVLIYKLGRVDTQSVSQLKNGGEVGFDLIRFDIDQCSLGDTINLSGNNVTQSHLTCPSIGKVRRIVMTRFSKKVCGKMAPILPLW
jgi:hypothetical protein